MELSCRFRGFQRVVGSAGGGLGIKGVGGVLRCLHEETKVVFYKPCKRKIQI